MQSQTSDFESIATAHSTYVIGVGKLIDGDWSGTWKDVALFWSDSDPEKCLGPNS
jgi:hypothetical protein